MCSKINNQTFDSKKERKAYTSAEYYEFFFGEDYEKEIRAVFDRGLLNNFDGTLGELEKVKRYFFDKLDRSPRQTCSHCRNALMALNASWIFQIITWRYPRLKK